MEDSGVFSSFSCRSLLFLLVSPQCTHQQQFCCTFWCVPFSFLDKWVKNKTGTWCGRGMSDHVCVSAIHPRLGKPAFGDLTACMGALTPPHQLCWICSLPVFSMALSRLQITFGIQKFFGIWVVELLFIPCFLQLACRMGMDRSVFEAFTSECSFYNAFILKTVHGTLRQFLGWCKTIFWKIIYASFASHFSVVLVFSVVSVFMSVYFGAWLVCSACKSYK